MTEPARLAHSKGLAATLLASAKADRAPEGASRRILAGVSVTAVLATKSSASVSSALHALARWASWKWIAVGIAGAGSVATVAPLLSARTVPVIQTSAIATPVVATPSARRSERRVQSVSPSAVPSASPLPPEPPRMTVAPMAPVNASPRLVTSADRIPTSAPQSSHLGSEIAAIDDAKRSLVSGSPASALRKLDAYDAAFPHGTLSAEAGALRIEALARSGQKSEARDAFARFREKNPGSPLLERLARAVGD